MKLAIASDHGGYALKEHLKKVRHDIEWVDCGTDSGSESVDYPDYATKLADAIKEKKADKGVLICGSGIGISIKANRYPHIRAAVCWDVTSARLTRLHNDANVLCLGERMIGQVTAEDCLKVFLETEFEGGRHVKRVEKLGC